ncbi:hypothetical protein CcaCcLH18_07728 [Colletotrichum camelliae]|nr:hypothetical protein CcaCcLH18_07728 [Colletotrichum camelliae]
MHTYVIAQEPDIDLILLRDNEELDEDEVYYDYSDSETLLNDASSIATSFSDSSEDSEDGATPLRCRLSTLYAAYETTSTMPLAVRFRVSSYVVREASPVMRELLSRHVGRPGAHSAGPGCPRVPLQNDDPEAMVILLRMLHQVRPEESVRHLFPRTDDDIDVHDLAAMALIVDKYQMNSTFEHQLQDSIDRLWINFDRSSSDEALAWTWISWAFELTDHFSEATLCLTQTMERSFGENQQRTFPLPEEIFPIKGTIDRNRMDALAELYVLFHAQLRAMVSREAGYIAAATDQTKPNSRSNPAILKAANVGWLLICGERLNFWPEFIEDFEGIGHACAEGIIRGVDPQCKKVGWHPSELSGVVVTDTAGGDDLTGYKSFFDLLDCQKGRTWGLALETFKGQREEQ